MVGLEGRKSKRRYLIRVSFKYLTSERSLVLLDIDVDDNLVVFLHEISNENLI